MIRELERHDRTLYLTLLANFSLMGGVVTLFGAGLAKVIESYGWSYTDAGTVYAAASVGFFTSSLIAGFLIDHFGSKPVLIAGLIAEAISLMFFARTPSVPLNVVLYFIIGLGLGSNEAITNAAVVRIEERGKSRLMNLIHAFWCVGAILGPLGVADLIHAQGDWLVVFPIFGSMILIMTLLLSLQRFPRPVQAVEGERRREEAPPGRQRKAAVGIDSNGTRLAQNHGRTGLAPRWWRALGSGTGTFVLLCALAIFVYIGVEKGVYSWVSEYSVRVLGAPASLGAAMVAIYWAGQFLGRLTISIAYRGSRLEQMLVALSSLTLVTLLVLVFIRVVWIAVACTFIAGIANSGIFPLVISLTGKYSIRGRSVGLVTSAGGIAGFLFPITVATISDAAGIATGFASVLAVSLVLLAVALIVKARVKALDRPDHHRRNVEARSA